MTQASGQDSTLTPLVREAIDWVVRLRSGAATMGDARAVERWRGQSPAHEAAFREAVAIRQGLQSLLAACASDGVVPFRPRASAVNRRSMLVGGGAIAASIAAACVVTRPPLGLWPSLAEMMADYRTGVGERRTVEPAAGVRVEMTTRTSIARMSDGRGIDLIAGEAFVALDRSDAFTTHVAGGAITATRASFDLRNVDGQACVTCVDGQVSVARGPARAVLTKGAQLTFSGQEFGQMQPADQAAVTAWRTGLLVFKDKRLGEVVAEINRYRTGRIILANNALKTFPVNAIFHIDQMDNAATQVEQLVGRRGAELPGGVVLIG